MSVSRTRSDLRSNFSGEQIRLIFRAEGGEEVVEVEGSPGVAVEHEESVAQLAAGSSADKFGIRDRLADLAAQKARNDAAVDVIEGRILQSEGVAGIAAQGFVAALACENDLDATASQFCDEVKRDAGRPADGLVLVPDQFREGAKEILPAEQDFVMNGMDMLGNQAGVGEFTVGGLGVAHGKSLDRRLSDLGHQRGQCAGIHAAAQQDSERNIAHEVAGDGLFQKITVGFDVIGLGAGLRFRLDRQVPVRRDM